MTYRRPILPSIPPGAAMALATGSEPFAFLGAANGSISRLVIHGERMIVRGFNETQHLDHL